MNLSSKIIQRIKELWEHKIFRYAIILNIFYFLLSIILFFAFFQEKNDFIIFYNVGNIFINDIENLYNQTYYLWDFRYLPLSALFFIPNHNYLHFSKTSKASFPASSFVFPLLLKNISKKVYPIDINNYKQSLK